MITIQSDTIQVTANEDGTALGLIDRKRGTIWRLDDDSLIYGNVNKDSGNPVLPGRRLVSRKAWLANETTLIVSYQAGENDLQVHYELKKEYLEVRLPATGNTEIGFVSFPGSFRPAGEALRLLLPIMQGMLWDGRGQAFEWVRGEGSHTGFSMAMFGNLGETGGLLMTAETRDDCRWWFGKDQAQRTWACNLQIASLGSLRYERVARLYLTDPDITAIAKQYRRKVIQQGRFKSWEEKIAERPRLENIFGALMAFIGYCEDRIDGKPFDYVENCRKLQAYGFHKVLLYPARFNIYYPHIQMGGVPAIHLPPDTVAAIKALGFDIAPWSWLNEALDTGEEIQRMFRRKASGEIMPHWAIDEQQWYQVCYSFIEGYQKSALESSIADQTWDHFDVLACVPPMECYAMDHPNHAGKALSRGEDRTWIRRAFQADQEAGLMVSSENFNDAYTLELDFGSVKAWPQFGPWPFWPVPLTMLVYHDSMVHSWWEIHNYNNPWRGRTTMLEGLFEYGGGRPCLMAAMDALMGCPPDVFPFGAQYGYSGHGKETFLYHYRFEDPEVQIALQAALPVARLHERIGKQEMVHFKILSEDGYIQESAFADGTHVVANFSRDFAGSMPGVDHKIIDGIDRLGPESWQID
jgi:hypothetical protein